MSETRTGCKWDREKRDYLRPDGDPCRTDDYGDPTKHCTSGRCANHIGPDELTCARCVGRVRANLRRIPIVSSLMLLIALEEGVDSEAANIAGPAADPEAWSWRKVAARQGKAWHLSLVEDDDEDHPYLVLGRWDLMLREDYDNPSDVPLTIANAAAYLERQLGRVAQDDGQDFPLFAREIRKCREHLERVLHTAMDKQRGAPCPDCTSPETGLGPRLVREYPHWCEDDDCERVHYSVTLDRKTGQMVPDDRGDRWVCPRDSKHWWDVEDYERWVEERTSA